MLWLKAVYKYREFAHELPFYRKKFSYLKMAIRHLVLFSLLVFGMAYILTPGVLVFVHDLVAGVLENVQIHLVRFLFNLFICISNWNFEWPTWVPSLSLPDMQTIWSFWSVMTWLVKWLCLPKPIPTPDHPTSDSAAEKPMPVFAPIGDSKFKDRAEELMVPLNWEDMTFKQEVTNKGEGIIDSLPLESYSERGDCDVQAGILVQDFPKTVELIAKDLKLPDEMKDRIINAARVREGDTRALERIDFNTNDGTFYFGKVAVIKKENGFLDMAYSLITIKYKVNEKARSAQMAEKLLKLAASKKVDESEVASMDFFKFSDVNSLKEYFQLRAVEEFNKKCKGPRRGLPAQ